MKSFIFPHLLLFSVTAVVLLVGCVPDAILSEKEGDKEGDLITFGASTFETDLPGTKTVYTGEFGTTLAYPGYSAGWGERIDWEPNKDAIRVISTDALGGTAVPAQNGAKAYHYADYLVKALPYTGVPDPTYACDRATLAPIGDGLRWNDEHDAQNLPYDFYAVYPAPPSGVSLSDPNYREGKGYVRITFDVPAEQPYAELKDRVAPNTNLIDYRPDMNLAYMYAGLQDRRSAPSLPLIFHPVVNAYEFTINAKDDGAKNFKLVDFQLSIQPIVSDSSSSEDALAGVYSGNISSHNTWESNSQVTNKSSFVLVSIPEADQKQLGTDSYRITVFSLPISGSPVPVPIMNPPYVPGQDIPDAERSRTWSYLNNAFGLTASMKFVDVRTSRQYTRTLPLMMSNEYYDSSFPVPTGGDDVFSIRQIPALPIMPTKREQKLYFTISVPGPPTEDPVTYE